MNRVGQKQAAKELLSRKAARADLEEFIRYTMPSYEPGPHHGMVIKAVAEAASKDNRRLIITIPPRHGKSEIVSVRLPAWYMGKWPTRQIICATYQDDFAADFGRMVRGCVQSDEFSKLFPSVKLSADSKAADRWSTGLGGAYKAAGVGGSLTGRGAHLAVIDDPLKGRAEADSKIERDRVWNWYRSVLYTRLMPGASIILLQTRWHDDDLAGRLLIEQDNGGDKWQLIDLPALAEKGDKLEREAGEALWPAWYPKDTLEQIRRTIGPREWSALYQQKPIEDEGAYFKHGWFPRYNPMEATQKFKAEKYLDSLSETAQRRSTHFAVYGASDFAVTADGGDYTVHLIIGIDPEDQIYVLDLWRDQTAPDVWIDIMADMIHRWKPLQWGCAKGQIQRSVGPFMKKRLAERKAYCHIEEYAEVGDKTIRARSIQARASMGKVLLPENADWLDAFLYELTRFPAGKNDDQIDALSMFGMMLDDLQPGRNLVPLEEPVLEMKPTTFGESMKLHRKIKRIGPVRESIVIAPNSTNWDKLAQEGKT